MCTEETGKNFNKFFVLSGVLQELRIGMEIILDIVGEGSCPLWAMCPREFGNLQEYEIQQYDIREHRKRVQHHLEIDQRTI